jgi:hypothetical protein
MKKPRLVIVEWDDAYSRSDWTYDDQIDEKFDDGGWKCMNVGWLIRQSKDHVTIAGRASFTNTSYGLLQRIPRGMIKRIRTLKGDV